MRTFTLHDHKINLELNYNIGGSAKENWNLIDSSKQNDIWFHLEHVSSPHVVLQIPSDIDLTNISKQTLIHCAVECKNYSKYKGVKKINVIYTEIKNVKKTDVEGSVTTKKTRTLLV